MPTIPGSLVSQSCSFTLFCPNTKFRFPQLPDASAAPGMTETAKRPAIAQPMRYPGRAMPDPLGIGRTLLVLGIVLALVGLLLMLVPRIPWIGRLPGDFSFGGKNWRVYIPLGASLVISLILTLVLRLFNRR